MPLGGNNQIIAIELLYIFLNYIWIDIQVAICKGYAFSTGIVHSCLYGRSFSQVGALCYNLIPFFKDGSESTLCSVITAVIDYYYLVLERSESRTFAI